MSELTGHLKALLSQPLQENPFSERRMPTGRLPNIFIAGFPKCGTTSLFSLLSQHVDIAGAIRENLFSSNSPATRTLKELYYFSREQISAPDLYDYMHLFRSDRRNAIDGTPVYATSQVAIERIAELIPNARIVILLREPVSRAFSAWNHWNQLPENSRWPMFVPTGSFEENISHEMEVLDLECLKEGFLSHGLYVKHLEILEKYFSREQIFYEFSANLRIDFYRVYRNLCDFLEIVPIPPAFTEANKRDYSVAPLRRHTRYTLREFFRPFDSELQDFLNRRLPWNI